MSVEDERMIELFWARDETAIASVTNAYGGYCRKIAMNLLGDEGDAEECVSDAMLALWRSIPPERPENLRVYLGGLVRNISVTLWRRKNRQKRGGMDIIVSELTECVPAAGDSQTELEDRELARAVSAWLRSIPAGDRALFLRRYWYGDSLKSLAEDWGVPANRLAQRMHRLRASLRKALDKEGFTV